MHATVSQTIFTQDPREIPAELLCPACRRPRMTRHERCPHCLSDRLTWPFLLPSWLAAGFAGLTALVGLPCLLSSDDGVLLVGGGLIVVGILAGALSVGLRRPRKTRLGLWVALVTMIGAVPALMLLPIVLEDSGMAHPLLPIGWAFAVLAFAAGTQMIPTRDLYKVCSGIFLALTLAVAGRIAWGAMHDDSNTVDIALAGSAAMGLSSLLLVLTGLPQVRWAFGDAVWAHGRFVRAKLWWEGHGYEVR